MMPPPPTQHPGTRRTSALDLIVASLLALIAAAALYRLLNPWPSTPDGLFHLQRARALAEAVAAGVFWPRWFPDFAFDYGYPVLNFYAPGFYYAPALFHLAGLDLVRSSQLALALWYAASGVGAYLLLRRWTGTGPALVGALAFMLFPYRLYDLAVRGALPEFAAFTWLPWIGLAAHGTLTRGERETRLVKETWFLYPLIGGAVAWAGLILTHNLTALLAALGTLAAIPVLAAVGHLLPKGEAPYLARAWGIGWRLLAPLALGAALAAPYSAPVLAEARWVGIGGGAHGYADGYVEHFAGLPTLFTWQPAYAYPAAADPTVPAPGYLAVGIAAGLLLAARSPRPAHRAALASASVVTALALWLTTAGSRPAWALAAPVLGLLQFPWRWQALLPLTGAILLATLLDEFAVRLVRIPTRGRTQAAAAALAAVAVLLAVHGLGRLPRAAAGLAAGDLTREQMWAYDAEQGQVGASWTGEFLPIWVTEPRWSISQPPAQPGPAMSPAAPPAARFSLLPVKLGLLAAEYRLESPEAVRLAWRRFYYPAWRVAIDGAPVATYPSTSLGLLTAEAPAGAHTVAVSWQPTPAAWAGYAVAAVAWAAVLILLLAACGRGHRLAAAGWALAGVAAAVLATSPWQITHVPAAVGADYGDVRLEAATLPPARPGQAAPLRLHWSIRQPGTEWVAFVHVVDGNGDVVAQHDAPLGGRYTPVGRWRPGQVLDVAHPVPLPDDLPPGRYAVKAGLYPPGQPGHPRLAAGRSDPRVDLGVLEVIPRRDVALPRLVNPLREVAP